MLIFIFLLALKCDISSYVDVLLLGIIVNLRFVFKNSNAKSSRGICFTSSTSKSGSIADM